MATRELGVTDFSFTGPLGSDGARIKHVGRNHFHITLGHAPHQPGWPNKLQFQILRHARGNDLRLDVTFDGGPKFAFNEYFSSWSCDARNWRPAKWEKGFRVSKQADTVVLPTFSEDVVYFATQVPFSYEDLLQLLSEVRTNPHVAVHTVGQSLEGRGLYRIEITDPDSDIPAADRWVHYFSDQHPGEHNAHWRMVGMLRWALSEAAADFRRRSICHFVFLQSPDGPSHGWYRTNAQGVDMNRSYRHQGADATEQPHEAYVMQKDLEELMRSESPVTDIWAMHTWQAPVEPILTPGPEFDNRVGPWTELRDIIQRDDPAGLVKPLAMKPRRLEDGGLTNTWTAGPHFQFGISAILCEGAGDFDTREKNLDSGVVLIKSLAEFYRGTKK